METLFLVCMLRFFETDVPTCPRSRVCKSLVVVNLALEQCVKISVEMKYKAQLHGSRFT